jgi:Xaa-Pro aminopeptidase
LQDLDAEAYVAEPGAQTQYFANFSNTNWKLSERPLLLIVTPHQTGKDGNIVAKVSLLTPKFEAPRAKLLTMPSTPEYVEWAEEQDPYSVAVEALGLKSASNPLNTGRKLFIDNSARHFLYDGFQNALTGTNLTVTSSPKEINRLRESKSDAEIEIMKCVNEVRQYFNLPNLYACSPLSLTLRQPFSVFAMFTSNCTLECVNLKLEI